MVDDASIARELGRGTSSDDACRALVELALDRGGRDNVTVVVATYRRLGPPGARPHRRSRHEPGSKLNAAPDPAARVMACHGRFQSSGW